MSNIMKKLEQRYFEPKSIKLFIIQEENGGLPDEPRLFTDQAKANAEYVALVNENVDCKRKAQNIDEAMMIMGEDWEEDAYIPEDWYVRMWEYDLKELGLIKQ
jgi:hypothetical protein